MVFRLRFALLFVVLFPAFSSAREGNPLTQYGLTPSQAEALVNLPKARPDEIGGYRVDILTKNDHGVPRTIVLVGEAHLKDRVAAERGEKLVRQFREIGVENANILAYKSALLFIVANQLAMALFTGEAFEMS